MYTFQGTPLVLRVTASRYPEDDDDDDDDDGEDGAAAGGGGKHCFRGLVEARTRVYVGPSTVFCSSASQKAVCEGLKLTGVEPMPERQTKNWCARARAHIARIPPARPALGLTTFLTASAPLLMPSALFAARVFAARASAARSVHVTTSDGEVFPVHRTLLRSCIALTKAVRDTQSAQPEVAVDVDCATFDRVLLFLEAASRLQQRGGSGGAQGDGGQAGGTQAGTQAGTEAGTEAGGGESSNLLETFAFDMHTLPSLSLAAKALGCRLLRECCEKRLGAFEERIGMHRWHEVVATNEKGGCMVTMDGMVFDLLAWLPEHPGGSTIIPQQALNVDCTVFFELYHASRESFTCKKSGLSDRTNPLLLLHHHSAHAHAPSNNRQCTRANTPHRAPLPSPAPPLSSPPHASAQPGESRHAAHTLPPS